MTLFAIHDPEGRVTQATKHFDPVGYDRLLDQHGLTYAACQHPHLRSHDTIYVANPQSPFKEVRERPLMPIEVSKTTIRCGESDATLLKGIPKGSTYAVTSSAGDRIWPLPGESNVLDAEELQISMPVPCRFRIVLDQWPFQTFAVDIEVVA